MPKTQKLRTAVKCENLLSHVKWAHSTNSLPLAAAFAGRMMYEVWCFQRECNMKYETGCKREKKNEREKLIKIKVDSLSDFMFFHHHHYS